MCGCDKEVYGSRTEHQPGDLKGAASCLSDINAAETVPEQLLYKRVQQSLINTILWLTSPGQFSMRMCGPLMGLNVHVQNSVV